MVTSGYPYATTGQNLPVSYLDYCTDTKLELNRMPIVQDTSCSHHYTEEGTEI